MNSEPYLILLADDDEADRMLFIEAFSELKIKTAVTTVNDGIQLMDWLHKQDNPKPHFLFLDLNMPRKNGLECLREIRSDKNLKELFVAIYSTSASDKDVAETFQEGANVYVTKPNEFKALKQLLYKAVSCSTIYDGDKFDRENFILLI